MRDFFQYYEKEVKIVCKDGDVLIGKVDTYVPCGDSDDFQVHLGIKTNKKDYEIDIPESDIESIEVID